LKDLFGKSIDKSGLREKFIEPPFSILDTKTGSWQDRKRKWKSLGIQSELGRNVKGKNSFNDQVLNPRKNRDFAERLLSVAESQSTFDPALTELMYKWFCPEKGKILDPFAGGSVRGIVANYLHYDYTGIELRLEQIQSNKEQAKIIIPENPPIWLGGDSEIVLDSIEDTFYDFIFSCPPYYDMEIYSEKEEDLSNLKSYNLFLEKYSSIIKKSCNKLKPGSFACFVVGEIRDKKGNYLGFVPDTIFAFKKAGMDYYNEAILLNAIASASVRAPNSWKNKKLTKIHQNVLIFKKSDRQIIR
jgi:DNA modification methylase